MLTNNDHNKNKNNKNVNNNVNKNEPSNAKPTNDPTDEELYETTIPGSNSIQQIHLSLRQTNYDNVDNDSDDDVMINKMTDPENEDQNPNPNSNQNDKQTQAATQPMPKINVTAPPTQRRSRRQRPGLKHQPPALTKMDQLNQNETATSRIRSRSKRRNES